MKTYEELYDLATEHFSEEVKVLYGTTDGNLFYEEHTAKIHARFSELEMHVLSAPEVEEIDEIEAEETPEAEEEAPEAEPETPEAEPKKTKKTKAE